MENTAVISKWAILKHMFVHDFLRISGETAIGWMHQDLVNEKRYSGTGNNYLSQY